jgi:hypothetical protein
MGKLLCSYTGMRRGCSAGEGGVCAIGVSVYLFWPAVHKDAVLRAAAQGRLVCVILPVAAIAGTVCCHSVASRGLVGSVQVYPRCCWSAAIGSSLRHDQVSLTVYSMLFEGSVGYSGAKYGFQFCSCASLKHVLACQRRCIMPANATLSVYWCLLPHVDIIIIIMLPIKP